MFYYQVSITVCFSEQVGDWQRFYSTKIYKSREEAIEKGIPDFVDNLESTFRGNYPNMKVKVDEARTDFLMVD